MSAPVFSSDPADYPQLQIAFASGGQFTPVILVIGGSYATNMVNNESDLDLWGVYLEDDPEEMSFDENTRVQLIGDSGWTQLIAFSLNKVRAEIADPYSINDPPRRIWHYENFMAYPRIYDSTYAEDFRTNELSVYDNATLAQWYLEGGDWHLAQPEAPKLENRATRLFLTGARLLEVGDLVVDYVVLTTWAGVSTAAEARARLENDI